MKKSLLQSALEIPRFKPSPVTDEMIELAVAWAKDEISTSQAASVLGTTKQNVYWTLCKSLKEAVKRGILK